MSQHTDEVILLAGTEITVAAWWNKKKPVRCKVLDCKDNFCRALPLEGNTHTRYFSTDDILSI